MASESTQDTTLSVPVSTGEPQSNITQMTSVSIADRSKNSLMVMNKQRTPIHIKWKNIRYSVAIKDPNAERKFCNKETIDKVILNDISGEARPGSLIAIMGPSGSGKTTLLNCLAKRITDEKGSVLEGTITLNGINREELGSRFARIAAYVQQDDVLFNMQTVDETLITAAKLRLSKDVALSDKQARCDAIIQELGLMKCRDTRIGDAKNRGVSGGERKRTNIGVEMIQDPSVLFLDEPTSGLDSFQALNVVETLKVLCHSGCTVIMSIHQPRSSIFQLFDQLILLAEGRLVYSGPAGKAAVEYFSERGFACPELFNPADYFLDIVSVDNRSSQEETKSKKRIQVLIDGFDKYNVKQKALKKDNKDDDNTPSSDTLSLDKFVPSKTVTSSYMDQIIVLGVRSIRQLLRDKFTLSIRLFMTLFFALFLSALYSEVDDGQKGIQDKQGILFFVTINQSFGPLINTLNVFTIEKTIVMRERQSKSYHLSSYYITKFLTSLPLEVIFPCIFGCVVYWIVNLKHTLEAFVIFLLVLVLCSLVSISMGFMLGALAPNPDAANAMAPLFMVLSILFGGFYINSDNIPEWIGWLENWSHIRWAYMAFAINEFEDAKFDGCDTDQSSCYSTGEQVLELLSFADWSLWEPIRNLLLWFFAYHFVAYLLLRFKKQGYMEVSQPSGDSHFTSAKAKDYKVDHKPTESKNDLIIPTDFIPNDDGNDKIHDSDEANNNNNENDGNNNKDDEKANDN